MRLLGTVLATAAVAITAFAASGAPNAAAADKAVEIRHGDGTYIKTRHARHYLGCPDRYSCSALYGAYAPYGGTGYWTAYSGYVPPEYR
jgi:hypothetical protein